MQHTRMVIVAAALPALMVCAASHAGEVGDHAVEVAKKWLAVVDSGDYAKSWTNAAEFFRNAISEERWEQAVRSIRDPLGEVVSRTRKSADYATELPGAPDGEYVVVQFETTFANKASAVETVTPMKDPDGVWRVSGYFIR